MDLQGKSALITGGGSGVGLGVALALAREGCRVAICGRGEKRLEKAAAEFPPRTALRVRSCDVSDRQQVNDLFAWLEPQFGTPDILVNSAGINVVRRRIEEIDPADWDRMLAVNATGAFNCIHRVLPGMRQRKSGLIINISSVSGKRVYKLAGVGYCASKFAVSALGTAVNLEEHDNGIRVTNIYPGEINTPILDQRPVPVPPEKKTQMIQPEDIAACVLTICKLPARVVVPELIITPTYQEYA